MMMNEDAAELLKTSMLDLAACADGEPNVVPAAFKDVTADGKLLVGDVFLEITLKNIRSNDGKIAISVYKVEESLIPFHDASGRTLMEWLGMVFCRWISMIPAKEKAETFRRVRSSLKRTMRICWRSCSTWN